MFEIDEKLCQGRLLSTRDYSQIDTVDLSDYDYNQFYQKYLLRNEPCLIRNISKNWICQTEWVLSSNSDEPNFEFLSKKYGHLNVTVSKCNKKYFNAHESFDCTLNEYLTYWRTYMKSENGSTCDCNYLKDFHLSRFDSEFYKVPSYFQSDWLNEYCSAKTNDDYRFVYMGPKGSWTPLHADVFNSFSWSVNICGQKLWLFFAPGTETHLKDPPNNKNLIFNENLEPFLIKNQIAYVKLIQNAGDGIFVPSGWHHQVHNLSNTISVNQNWINACNLEHVWKSMLLTLAEVQEEFAEAKSGFEDDFEWVQHCQLGLNTIFGMNFWKFFDFLQFIKVRRIQMLNGDIVTSFGTQHLLFDLKVLNKVLNNLENHCDFQILKL